MTVQCVGALSLRPRGPIYETSQAEEAERKNWNKPRTQFTHPVYAREGAGKPGGWRSEQVETYMYSNG